MLPCEKVNDYFATRRVLIDDHLKSIATRTDAQVVNYLARRLVESQGKLPSL